MFIYKLLTQDLHALLMEMGYQYLWFDGYMNYAPIDSGERMDIRRIVPLREISKEIEESRELARMLHQSETTGTTQLHEALTQDEFYPISYFTGKLGEENLPDPAVAIDDYIFLRDARDWYVEVEV